MSTAGPESEPGDGEAVADPGGMRSHPHHLGQKFFERVYLGIVEKRRIRSVWRHRSDGSRYEAGNEVWG